MSDISEIIGFTLTVAALAAALGCDFGATVMEKRYQREAIKRGFAEPAKPAAEWKWKEPTK